MAQEKPDFNTWGVGQLSHPMAADEVRARRRRIYCLSAPEDAPRQA